MIFTFDDGPHEKWSAKILDTLAAHRVNAIFYWVGHRVGLLLAFLPPAFPLLPPLLALLLVAAPLSGRCEPRQEPKPQGEPRGERPQYRSTRREASAAADRCLGACPQGHRDVMEEPSVAVQG